MLQIKALAASIKNVRAKAEAAGIEEQLAVDEVQQADMVLKGHGPGGDLRKLLKRPNPTLMQFLLGAATNVITVRVRTLRHLSIPLTLGSQDRTAS